MKLSDIRIRDPFVLPHAASGKYYLVCTRYAEDGEPRGLGFDVYASRDLREWEGPVPAFRPPAGFWATKDFWAPELHEYRGRYFMFASFKADGVCRGTQILVADKPEGPYLPHSVGPLTPRDWECLDGTLHIDRAGLPWMVFCHEWVQIGDGTICAVRLTPDLKESVGAPVELFTASSAPWVREHENVDARGRVTDGPFLYPSAAGVLLMLWSSMGSQGYAMGWAVSASGELTGPWKQQTEPFFPSDGGHGMLFRDFGGQLYLALHVPNRFPDERANFIPMKEEKGLIARDPETEIIR